MITNKGYNSTYRNLILSITLNENRLRDISNWKKMIFFIMLTYHKSDFAAHFNFRSGYRNTWHALTCTRLAVHVNDFIEVRWSASFWALINTSMKKLLHRPKTYLYNPWPLRSVYWIFSWLTWADWSYVSMVSFDYDSDWYWHRVGHTGS